MIRWLLLLLLLGCAGCSTVASVGTSSANLSRPTDNRTELRKIPSPKGKIPVAVYNFRDQTGQYKPLPNVSSFSTAVTQGATTILIEILKKSNWFVPVEREGLQNLLTERKIIRAAKENSPDADKDLPPLEMASVLIEGGIVGYDTNVVTGGLGAKYFGIGGSVQYRIDQIAVALRATDVRTGRVLKTISTTKTVLSREIEAGVFRFVSLKRLLEAEMGVTTNEPVQIAVTGAIEKAVASLIIEGVLEKLWELKDPSLIDSEVFQDYLTEPGYEAIELAGS